MIDDWDDPLDSANPFAAFFWSAWHCPRCAEDGEESDLLKDRRCPHCGALVETITG